MQCSTALVWVTVTAPYLGPARSVPVLIHHDIFRQSPLTVVLAPGFKRCPHKAMDKKDIGFNGLTEREESFKEKQNKCITTVASHRAFSVEGFGRLTQRKGDLIRETINIGLLRILGIVTQTQHRHCSFSEKTHLARQTTQHL